MSEAGKIPPMPYKVQVLDAQGFVNEPWAKWLRALFVRVGGLNSVSNTDLKALVTTNNASLNAQMTALQANVNAQVAGLTGFGLNQGAQL